MRHMKAALGANPLLPRRHHRTRRHGDHPDPQEWPTLGEACPAAVARDETLRATRYYGRAFWKRWTGYYARSSAEAKRRGLKSFGYQTAEIHIRVALMNRFNALGTAEIVRVA